MYLLDASYSILLPCTRVLVQIPTSSPTGVPTSAVSSFILYDMNAYEYMSKLILCIYYLSLLETLQPSNAPTSQPSNFPTQKPTFNPTSASPTAQPTNAPTTEVRIFHCLDVSVQIVDSNNNLLLFDNTADTCSNHSSANPSTSWPMLWWHWILFDNRHDPMQLHWQTSYFTQGWWKRSLLQAGSGLPLKSKKARQTDPFSGWPTFPSSY